MDANKIPKKMDLLITNSRSRLPRDLSRKVPLSDPRRIYRFPV